MALSSLHNIYLVGPMGAGKTTIGRQLAKHLGKPFYDSDIEVETRCGATISWIFDIEGEIGFRQRESHVIEDLCQLQDIVLSTGGGSILYDENREKIQTHGLVIYLKVPLELQIGRAIRRLDKRPILNTPSPTAQLVKTNQIREPLYQEIADLTFEVNQEEPYEVVGRILEQLKTIDPTYE